MREFVLGS